MTARATGAGWARGLGVTLAPIDVPHEALPPGLRRALLDGIARGGAARGAEGALPAFPASAERYAIRAGGETVGVLAVARRCPAPGLAAVLAVAVDPAHRGHAYAARALLAAERRLREEGFEAVRVRVPRTNGRGLYFMLRCGFVPTAPVAGDDATWFARGATPGRA